MIQKTLKLDLRKDRSFFKTAQSIFHQDYSLYWKQSEQPGFQVVVAKRTVSSAVERNTVRRRVFEVFESLLPEYIERKLAIVVVVRKKQLLENLTELKQTLQTLGS